MTEALATPEQVDEANCTLFVNPDEYKLFMSTLRTLGAVRATVHFSGGGDSGDITAVLVMNSSHVAIDLTDLRMPFTQEIGRWEGNQLVNKKVTGMTSYEDILRTLCEQALDTTDLDWYNNDGGQGDLTIDFTQSPPSITLDVGINYTTTENHSYDF